MARTLMRLHRAWLLQSVTLPHIIAQEIQARRQMEQVARIGQINQQITSQEMRVAPLPSHLADGGADSGSWSSP